jgi:hypothetical protein
MAIVLSDTGETTVDAVDGLWLTGPDIERALGWMLKPEGMCRDTLCIPLQMRDGRVDVAAFWSSLGRPVVREGDTWALGAGAEQRNDALAGLLAPDFTLPDVDGMSHTLSTLRGKKVFLCSWASW